MVFRIFLKGVESGVMEELRAAAAPPYALEETDVCVLELCVQL